MPDKTPPSVFYRVRYADGRVAIADSLESLPQSERARAERIELQASPPLAPPPALVAGIEWTSFGFGFGAALVVVALLLILGRGSKRILPFALGVGLLALGAAAYFGWLRRTAGQESALFASPAAVVEDARQAVEKMERKRKEQRNLLEQIDREAK